MNGGVIIAQCAVDDDVFDELDGRPIRSVEHDDVRRIYPTVNIDGKIQRISRYVIGKNPSTDDTMVVDHIDGNTCNNLRSNLRWLSQSDNVRNQRSKTASGYRGVYKTKNGEKWYASFHSNNRSIHGGTYETAKEAAIAHDALARNALGADLELNIILNFPNESSIKDLSHVKRLAPRGLPCGVYKNPNGTYLIQIVGFPRLKVKTLEEASEIQAQYVRDRDNAKLAKIIVDGKIAMFNKAGTINGYTLVDDDMLRDVALKCPHLNTNGYAQIVVSGVATRLHRYIYSRTLEDPTVLPPMIDHIDGNPLNNKRSNLRASNASSNVHAKRKRSGTSSMYYGVTKHSKSRGWHSMIMKDGIVTRKYFANEIDAAKFYNENAIRLYGTHAQLNVLPSGSGLDGPTSVDDHVTKTA